MRSRALGFNPLWINTALKRCSQNTFADPRFNPLWINTALKQKCQPLHSPLCFNPLWINTALKPVVHQESP